MTVKVYYTQASELREKGLSQGARELFETLVKEEGVKLQDRIPLKVHFGERGNKTFIGPENFDGIIDSLKERNIDSCFIETNVLYRSDRTTREKHIKLALENGFTRLPIVIADGERGEDYAIVTINKKHYRTCRIGKEISKEKQLIVLSHFKGHMLAGFGGAIKQLGMGCAARGGKLAQHANSKPILNPLKCKKCMTCVANCPQEAIEIGRISRINRDKCIGCAACIAVCPHGAFKVNWLSTTPKTFREKLAEYAYAAAKDRDNIYITYATNITKGCDCEGKTMKPIAEDLGILASRDPVAIDKACCDLLNKREERKVFRGDDIFEHAESIGLGTTRYQLVWT